MFCQITVNLNFINALAASVYLLAALLSVISLLFASTDKKEKLKKDITKYFLRSIIFFGIFFALFALLAILCKLTA